MSEFLCDLEVGSFALNAITEIRGRLTRANDHPLVDLRLFAMNHDGEFVPTPKGICVARARAGDLLSLVQRLADAVGPQDEDDEPAKAPEQPEEGSHDTGDPA